MVISFLFKSVSTLNVTEGVSSKTIICKREIASHEPFSVQFHLKRVPILIFWSSSRFYSGTNFQLNARGGRKFWNANLQDLSIPLSLNRLLLECLQFLLWRWGLWSWNCFKNKSLTSFNVSTNSRRIFPLARSFDDTLKKSLTSFDLFSRRDT